MRVTVEGLRLICETHFGEPGSANDGERDCNLMIIVLTACHVLRLTDVSGRLVEELPNYPCPLDFQEWWIRAGLPGRRSTIKRIAEDVILANDDWRFAESLDHAMPLLELLLRTAIDRGCIPRPQSGGAVDLFSPESTVLLPA